jgi:hypothetical protein
MAGINFALSLNNLEYIQDMSCVVRNIENIPFFESAKK